MFALVCYMSLVVCRSRLLSDLDLCGNFSREGPLARYPDVLFFLPSNGATPPELTSEAPFGTPPTLLVAPLTICCVTILSFATDSSYVP